MMLQDSDLPDFNNNEGVALRGMGPPPTPGDQAAASSGSFKLLGMVEVAALVAWLGLVWVLWA